MITEYKYMVGYKHGWTIVDFNQVLYTGSDL